MDYFPPSKYFARDRRANAGQVGRQDADKRYKCRHGCVDHARYVTHLVLDLGFLCHVTLYDVAAVRHIPGPACSVFDILNVKARPAIAASVKVGRRRPNP